MSTPEAGAARRIVHLTTVHARDDIRIFHKQCRTLARAGYDVVQIVGDGRGDALTEGVRIVDIGARPVGRLERMRQQPVRAWEAVLREKPALLHFHDPELLPLGARLARTGVPVVYDAHEDVPRQILTKRWIPAPMRGLVSRGFEIYENRMVRRLSAVVAATPHITERFAAVARQSVTVANYPFSDELAPLAEGGPRERAACYVGSITRSRGAIEMLRAIALLPDVTLHLAGSFEDESLRAALQAEPGWRQVQFHGQVGRDKVRSLMARCGVGLVTLLPMPSYLDSLPIKLFEYMSAKLPIIASDFPLWREIVLRHGCGQCVDPTSPRAIADAIHTTLSDPLSMERMGNAGRTAVLAEYQWTSQESRLLALYQKLFSEEQKR